MFSKNSSIVPRLYAALFCVFACASLIFNSVGISAQTKRFNTIEQNLGGAPVLTATLTDAFPDPDGDGRAAAGAEVTYTATITNNDSVDVTNVSFTAPIDSNSTIVADSVQVHPDLNYVVRCTFNTGGSGSGNCSLPSTPHAVTDVGLNTIIGGQSNYLNVEASNVSYNSGTGIFQFDATVQNLISNALGTLDGVTPDAAGIRLFLQNSRVSSGTGSVSIANADGTATFTSANQPYFQYSHILQKDEVTPAKTVQVNVPSTISSFSVEFLVSTKVQLKVVINEVLVNPGGTISDASGEWFELYNDGQLPVNLKNFLINDFASSDSGLGCEIGPNGTTNYCARPAHTIASDLIIPSGGYATLGNTTNTTNNGGVPIDYAYGSMFTLANSLDGVRLRTPNALLIDKTFFASAAVSAQNGISRELIHPTLDNVNVDGSNWADALVTAVYGPGGRGTPKAQNSTFNQINDPFTNKSFADEASAVENFAPVVNNGGETVTANLGTISPGGSATVIYRVTIADPMPIGATQISGQGSVSGDNFGVVVTDDPSTPWANDATVTQVGLLTPTAAVVSISGRVLTSNRHGLSNALIYLTDLEGSTRAARTNSFGYYRFNDITAGQSVTVAVVSKRYQFLPQVVTVNEEMNGLNFLAEQ